MSKLHNPAHPGEVFRRWIPEEMTITTAAEQLGVLRVMLSKILNPRAGISAYISLRLSARLSTTPGVWLELQSARDLWEAEQRPLPAVAPLKMAA